METSTITAIFVCSGVVLLWAYVIINSDKKGKLIENYQKTVPLELKIDDENQIKIVGYILATKEHDLGGFFLPSIPRKDMDILKTEMLKKLVTLVVDEINNRENNDLMRSLTILNKSIKFWTTSVRFLEKNIEPDSWNIAQRDIIKKTNYKIFALFDEYLSKQPNYIMIDAICDYLHPEKPTDEEGRLSTIFLITSYANRNPETPYRETAILIRNKKIQEFLKENSFDKTNYRVLMDILAMDGIDPKIKTDGEKFLYQIVLQAIDDLQNKENINVEKTIQVIKDLDCIISNHKQIQQDLQVAKELSKSINADEEKQATV